VWLARRWRLEQVQIVGARTRSKRTLGIAALPDDDVADYALILLHEALDARHTPLGSIGEKGLPSSGPSLGG
jgi:hypothetical protein